MFEVSFFETGIGAEISNENVQSKETWLRDSLKAAWIVWAELGWEAPGKIKIKAEDGKSPKSKSWKSRNRKKNQVIEKIARVDRISRLQGFDINTNFNQGGDQLLEIISLIKKNCFYFDSNMELAQFRHVTTLYLATGIKRGLDMSNRDSSEHFIHSIHEVLGSQLVEYPNDAELYFNRFQTETLISCTGAPNTEIKLNCDYITVEL